METRTIRLWDDNPASRDLLGFDSVVAPVLAALATPDLDPIAIGVHGPWGSGKSTLLHLIEGSLKEKSSYVVVRTDPWEYDDHNDVKGTLIGQVLGELRSRFADNADLKEKLKNLAKRISWTRVGAALARGAITMQWDAEKLLEAFTPEDPAQPQTLAGFRDAFAEVVAELPEVERVVVLVDDLDRCLPGAVMATLESIKLFLAVPKMAFVLAADQDMIRDAIGASLESSRRSERFASRYLEKIVQLPIYLPRLAAHDAEAYVGLLLSGQECGVDAEFERLVRHCDLRRAENKTPILGELSELPYVPSEPLRQLAAQLAQGLGADKVGNPREIKRFLNAFGVRRHIAETRKLTVTPAVIIKLLLLEDRFRDEFDHLASLRESDRMQLLTEWEAWAKSGDGAPPEGIREETKGWAAAEPSLAQADVGAYISLAASLVSSPLDVSLSDDLAAIVARICGPSEADRRNAVDEAAKRGVSEQRQVVASLLDHARRVDDLGAVVESLVGLAVATAELADEVARGVRETCWLRLDPAAAVVLGTSGSEPLTALARELKDDGNVEPDVREAARGALENE